MELRASTTSHAHFATWIRLLNNRLPIHLYHGYIRCSIIQSSVQLIVTTRASTIDSLTLQHIASINDAALSFASPLCGIPQESHFFGHNADPLSSLYADIEFKSRFIHFISQLSSCLYCRPHTHLSTRTWVPLIQSSYRSIGAHLAT